MIIFSLLSENEIEYSLLTWITTSARIKHEANKKFLYCTCTNP